MKVFVSWSGEASKEVAEALATWLKQVIQALDPFVSSKGILPGSTWFGELRKELVQARAGILCITPENLEAPWLLFEAGALSKTVESVPFVCPYLVGVETDELTLPLSGFQGLRSDKDGTEALVHRLNGSLGSDSLSYEVWKPAFEQWWPGLKDELARIRRRYKASWTGGQCQLLGKHRQSTRAYYEGAFTSGGEIYYLSIMSQSTLKKIKPHLDAARDAGTQINVLTLDPNVDDSVIDAIRLHLQEAGQSLEITRQQAKHAWELWRTIGKEYPHVEVRKYKTVPTMQAILVKDKYVSVELIPYATHTDDRPGFLLTRQSSEELFGLFQEKIISLWEGPKDPMTLHP